MADVLRFNAERLKRRLDKSELLKAGRKKLAQWRQHIEQRICAGGLIDFDGRFAAALCNFPSATLEGRVWAGQERFAKSLSRAVRTIHASQKRMQADGCLVVER